MKGSQKIMVCIIVLLAAVVMVLAVACTMLNDELRFVKEQATSNVVENTQNNATEDTARNTESDTQASIDDDSERYCFEGKTAAFYGDSITEVNYHYTKGWHQWVAEQLGLASYNNYGKSGATLKDIYEKLSTLDEDSDIIFVMGGINDQTYSVPLGSLGDNTTATTYGCIDLICKLLQDKLSDKMVIFVTPSYQTKYPHSGGITSDEVSAAIKEVCKKYPNISVYDNYSLCEINSTNLSEYTTDNCHWNDKTHEIVGKSISSYLLGKFYN